MKNKKIFLHALMVLMLCVQVESVRADSNNRVFRYVIIFVKLCLLTGLPVNHFIENLCKVPDFNERVNYIESVSLPSGISLSQNLDPKYVARLLRDRSNLGIYAIMQIASFNAAISQKSEIDMDHIRQAFFFFNDRPVFSGIINLYLEIAGPKK